MRQILNMISMLSNEHRDTITMHQLLKVIDHLKYTTSNLLCLLMPADELTYPKKELNVPITKIVEEEIKKYVRKTVNGVIVYTEYKLSEVKYIKVIESPKVIRRCQCVTKDDISILYDLMEDQREFGVIHVCHKAYLIATIQGNTEAIHRSSEFRSLNLKPPGVSPRGTRQ